jgi:hypothetical protein
MKAPIDGATPAATPRKVRVPIQRGSAVWVVALAGITISFLTSAITDLYTCNLLLCLHAFLALLISNPSVLYPEVGIHSK